MLDFDRSMKMPSGAQPTTWELPDGTLLKMGPELTQCTEILWRTAPDYVQGGDRQVEWRQRRRMQNRRRPLSTKERRMKSNTGDQKQLSKIPLSDLPGQGGGGRGGRRGRGLADVKEHGEGEGEALEDESFDPRIARDFSDIAGALLETYHMCADHSTTGKGIRTKVVQNTVYAGGTTMHAGFQTRAKYELEAVAGGNAKDLVFWSTEAPLFATYKGEYIYDGGRWVDAACGRARGVVWLWFMVVLLFLF